MQEFHRVEIAHFSGRLIHPGEDGYDAARTVYNAMIDRRPAVMARVRNADDIVAAVSAARRQGLPLSIFCGGHGVTGTALCDDGICVDLREMNNIEVDPVARTARVEAGANWGQFDRATGAHGLVMTGGRNPTTGVAGLALGSGSGWIERKFGFVCDNLVSAELVTADGRKVVASESENPDLFWAIRGGGGNYGIVSAFTFRLHALPMMLAGPLLYPAAMAGDLLRFYRDFMETAPDELGGGFQLVTAPDAPFVPEPGRGQPVAMIQIAYAGDPIEGEKVIAPLRELQPVADLVRPMTYADFQASGPDFHGTQNYWTADFLTDLPDEAIDIFASHALDPVSPESALIMIPGGGAPSRVPEDATAFGQRTSPWNVHYICGWRDPADNARNIAKVKAISASMKRWATGRVYLNYIGDEGQGRIDSSFGAQKMARLRAIKAVWDPDNFFRFNQNIAPAALAAE